MRSIITVEELTQAIKNSPDIRGTDNMGMQDKPAYALAQHVLNFFGYSDRIIDNILEPEDRDAFYMLEDASILTTEREETTLYDGREWRIHYWLFKRDKIAKLIAGDVTNGPKDEGTETLYSDLPNDAWDSRAGASKEAKEATAAVNAKAAEAAAKAAARKN
jgi:hypothetical protein